MALAKLSHAALICPKGDLEELLAGLFEFGEFHPMDRSDLVQDIEVLRLTSRAQAVYADAAHLLPTDFSPSSVPSKEPVLAFRAKNPVSLVDQLAKTLDDLRTKIALVPDKSEAKKLLVYDIDAVRETALGLFNGLCRIRFTYEDKRFCILEGYVPSEQIKLFRRDLSRFLLFDGPVDKKEAETENVPSMFSNSRLVSLFENITLMRGFPKYNEIDPTPVTALVFPLFFGIMFSDLGQGIVLFIFGYALWKLYRGNYNYWGELLMVLGSASMVTGFIRGSFFGYEFKSPLELIVHFPPVLTEGFSLNAVPFWLEISIILGTFHLSSSYFLYLLNRWRSKEYLEALLSGIPTIVLYGSAVPLTLALIGAGLQIPNLFADTSPTPFFLQLLGISVPINLVADVSLPIFLAAIVTLVVGRMVISYRSDHGRWRLEKSIGLGLLEGLVKPFEFFSNTLSYLRLGILAILGMILTSLAVSALAFGPLGLVAAILANIGIMAIEAFMVYIQDLRLHVYEWFSNFYTGTGIPFDPLASRGLEFSVQWGVQADRSKKDLEEEERIPVQLVVH